MSSYKMFIAYLNTPQDAEITQVFNLNKFSANIKANDVSDASFYLSNNDPTLTRANFKEFTQIRINRLDGNSEKTIIEGVIKIIESDLNGSRITVNSFDYLFKRKKTYSALTLEGNLTTFLTSVLSQINTRYNTNRTLDCDISDTVSLGQAISAGTSFFDILKKIPNIEWKFYTSNGSKIIKVRRSIGEDRTTGPNFLEFRRDIINPKDRSIKTAKHILNGDNIANAVNDSYNRVVTDPDSITEFGRVEESVTTSGTDTIDAYLAEHKISVAELEITPKSLDFFEANIGDTVKVYIYVGNDIMYYNGGLKVVSKTVSGDNLKQVKIGLSKTKATTLGVIDTIKDLKDRIKLQELRI